MVVYGAWGGGSYSIRITSTCVSPTPYPTQNPTPYPTAYPTAYPTSNPGPCGVYKSDSRDGYLNQGQAAVYAYAIPSDSRSKIEWSLTSSSSSSGGDTPVIIASADNPEVKSSSSSGSSSFDLYVLKDCNPRTSTCSTRYFSRGPNSYVSINAPTTGSIYYVMIYASSGSATYHLKMNSYKCTSGSNPIAMSSPETSTMEANGGQDTGSGSDISPPTADFVETEGAQ